MHKIFLGFIIFPPPRSPCFDVNDIALFSFFFSFVVLPPSVLSFFYCCCCRSFVCFVSLDYYALVQINNSSS